MKRFSADSSTSRKVITDVWRIQAMSRIRWLKVSIHVMCQEVTSEKKSPKNVLSKGVVRVVMQVGDGEVEV